MKNNNFKSKALSFLFIFFALFGWADSSYAASPVLHFSDLTSGPKTGLGDGLGEGAIVTVWGNNLGATQGSSKIYFKDALNVSREAAYVYEWTDATQHAGHPADLYAYHQMQDIMFSIPSASADGAGKMYVTVDGVSSNELDFTVRSGNIYFVKTSGTDTGDGSGTNGDWNHPWATPQYYTRTLAGVAAGSILYVGDGLNYSGAYGVYCSGRDGTADAPYFVTAYPGASVVFTHNSPDQPGGFGPDYDGATNGGAVFAYWHISKITLQGGSRAYVWITNGRLIGCEIMDNQNPAYACIAEQGGLLSASGSGTGLAGVDGNVVLGNYIHDYCNGLTGDKQQHTMYLQNRSGRGTGSAWEVGWNYLNNNWGNGGIHCYDEGASTNWSSPVKIHDNVVKDQRGWGIGVGPGAATGYPIQTEFRVYNNLLIRTGRGPGFADATATLTGISVGGASYNGDQTMQQYTVNVFNNTLYDIGEDTRDVSMSNPVNKGAMQLGSSGYPTINWRNNIVYDSINQPYFQTDGVNSPAIHTNNLWYSTTPGHTDPPSWDSAPITSDPLFTNAGSGDFSLQLLSPAINAGSALVSSVVTRDFLSLSRPQDSAFDLGAFEYASGGGDVTAPSAPSGLSVQ